MKGNQTLKCQRKNNPPLTILSQLLTVHLIVHFVYTQMYAFILFPSLLCLERPLEKSSPPVMGMLYHHEQAMLFAPHLRILIYVRTIFSIHLYSQVSYTQSCNKCLAY